MILGCGSTSNDSSPSDNNSKEQTIFVPKNIGIEIPDALTKSTPSQNKIVAKMQKEESTDQSYGYLQLQNDIEMAEGMKQEVEMNLFLADKLMADIEEQCQDIPLGETCTIAVNQLSVMIDDDFISGISEIMGSTPDDSIDQIKGQSVPLGVTSFTQYDNAALYQYALTIDTTESEKFVGATDVLSSIQTIKWSKDENRVLSVYVYEDSSINVGMTLNYTKKTSGEKEMDMKINFADAEGSSDTFNFNLTADTNERYTVVTSLKANYSDEGTIYNSEFASSGEISPSGGYLIFSGNFADIEFKEKELFDGNGSVIFSGYCDSMSECDMNDDTTWLTFGDDDLGIEEDFAIDESFETLENYEYVSLKILDSDAQEGYYLILPPQSDITGKSEEEIYEMSIGSLDFAEDYSYGYLMTSQYNDVLESLVIVSVQYPDSVDQMIPTFEIVTGTNRPNFEVETVE